METKDKGTGWGGGITNDDTIVASDLTAKKKKRKEKRYCSSEFHESAGIQKKALCVPQL